MDLTLPKALNTSTSFCLITTFCAYILCLYGTEQGGVRMPTLTLSIPRELKERMDAMPEVNWPEVLRVRLEKRASQLLKFEKMRKRGEL